MSQRVVSRRKLRKSAIGDLRTPIILSQRSLLSPDGSSCAPSVNFENSDYIWSMCETTSRKELFSGTNLLGVRTHRFTIRYPYERITTDYAVLFNDNVYDVLSVQDWEERQEFLVINCGEKGPQEYESNW